MAQITVDITQATTSLLKGFENLSEKKIQLSIMRAINNTLGKTQTKLVRATYERYNMKSSTIAGQVEVFKATTSVFYSGNINIRNKQYTLSAFNPRQISDGVATGRFSRSGEYQNKNVKSLRANNQRVTQGVIVQVLRGQDRVIASAFLSFKGSNMENVRTSARGKYNNGFNFDTEQGAKTLRTVSVRTMVQNAEVQQNYADFANTEYSRQLYNELRKRVNSIGERNARF